jgi:signal transduction histidine kinase
MFTNLKQKPILIIDDEPMIREMVELMLNEDGYRTISFDDGEKGLEAFQQIQPYVVITDIRMPKIDGIEVLTRIKKMRPATEVIVITGHGDMNLAIKALQMNASDFIQKPFGYDVLSVAVKRAYDKIKMSEQLAQAQLQLLQAEKMASLGQLAAGIAHEINNPIGFVNSNLSTLRKYLEKIDNTIKEAEALLAKNDSNLETFKNIKKNHKLDFILKDMISTIDESLEGTQRVKHIVQGLKEFSHIDTQQLVSHNINDCVNSTVNIAWNELKHRCKLEKRLGKLQPIICHPQQINQVILNLLMNSVEAVGDDGRITITTASENSGVRLEIADNGSGIPEEIIDKIFNPFFTTKEVGKGTGLGLHIVYGIINKHGGRIEVKSEVGKGTNFIIRLPEKPPII